MPPSVPGDRFRLELILLPEIELRLHLRPGIFFDRAVDDEAAVAGDGHGRSIGPLRLGIQRLPSSQ